MDVEFEDDTARDSSRDFRQTTLDDAPQHADAEEQMPGTKLYANPAYQLPLTPASPASFTTFIRLSL